MAGYIAGNIWQQSTTKAPVLLSPADFGCSWDSERAQWQLQWMTASGWWSMPCNNSADAPRDVEDCANVKNRI